MAIEEANQDSQSKEEALQRKTFLACTHDYRIDAGPFIKNVASNNVYPGEWFELGAENLYSCLPDGLFSCDSSPVYAECMKNIIGIRNRVSRQEGAIDMNTTRKAEVSRGTILVVSKDPAFLNSLHSIFGDLGYHVVPTDVYGHGLMGILDKITPNLVIIDIGMPSMTGVRTTLLVRIHTAIPTILLTKWQTDKNTFRKLDVDSPDSLSGPITSDDLVKLVDSVKMWHEDVNL